MLESVAKTHDWEILSRGLGAKMGLISAVALKRKMLHPGSALQLYHSLQTKCHPTNNGGWADGSV